jgi:hypothetical protein
MPVRVPGATLAEVIGLPFPSFTPAAPAAAEPERDGTWVLDFLAEMADDAAEGAGRRIGEGCKVCNGSPIGWCDDCTAALARTARYARLGQLLESAAGDTAAVSVLLRTGWR